MARFQELAEADLSSLLDNKSSKFFLFKLQNNFFEPIICFWDLNWQRRVIFLMNLKTEKADLTYFTRQRAFTSYKLTASHTKIQ